jgi:hypothetical protein
MTTKGEVIMTKNEIKQPPEPNFDAAAGRLVLQSNETSDPFTVTLAAGTHAVEWFSVNTREAKGADKVTVGSNGNNSFTAPFAEAGPAVLYLRQKGKLI